MSESLEAFYTNLLEITEPWEVSSIMRDSKTREFTVIVDWCVFFTASRIGGIVYRNIILFHPMVYDRRMQLYFVYSQRCQKITGKTLACGIEHDRILRAVHGRYGIVDRGGTAGYEAAEVNRIYCA